MCELFTMNGGDRRRAFKEHLTNQELKHISHQVYFRHGSVEYEITGVTRYDSETTVAVRIGCTTEVHHLMPLQEAV